MKSLQHYHNIILYVLGATDIELITSGGQTIPQHTNYVTLSFLMRPDGIAQEANETFSLIITLSWFPVTRGVFTATIRDSDCKNNT